jgi:Flp pilus assembly protein TadG
MPAAITLCRNRRSNRRCNGVRGGAIVEAVIVMPLLLMVTFGAAEYSYFFYVKNAMLSAARDGVRAAITSSAANSNVTSAVDTSLSAANISYASCNLATVPSDVSTAAAGSSVTVTITVAWSAIGISPLPVSMGGIASTKQVVASAVMMKE